MRKLLAILLLGVYLLNIGCSVPDPDDLARVTQAYQDLPPEARHDAKKFEANRRAAEVLSDRDPSDIAYTATCTDDAGNTESFDATVREILSCLERSFRALYGDCTFDIVMEKLVLAGHKDSRCTFVAWPGYLPDEQPNEWEVDDVTDEDVARSLIASQEVPAWVVAVIAAGIGFALVGPGGLFPLLCALDVEWSCPSSPQYPGQTPQPPPGDR